MEMASERTFEEVDAVLIGPEKYARVTPSGIRQHANQLSRVASSANLDSLPSSILSGLAGISKHAVNLQ